MRVRPAIPVGRRPVSASSAGRRRPLVTVVVPCYNYGRFLNGCVASIIAQPGVDTDVLIIDDASTDGSAEVAQQLADRHKNVRFIGHTVNRGHIKTYNEGLESADSDYLVLLSADDMLTPGALGRATGLMQADSSVGLVYGHPQVFEEAPRPVRENAFSTWSTWSGENWIGAQFRRGLSLIYSPEAVVRTSVHHAAGYYRPELPHSGDLEMWLRIAALASVGRVNGPDQAYRRVHPVSMMHTQYNTVVDDLRERNRAFEMFLDTAGAGLGNAAELRQIGRRRVCQEALGWACTVVADPEPSVAVDVAAAVDFAQGVYPDYESLRVWREFQHHARDQTLTPSAVEWFRGGQDVLARDLSQRLHWRRWRYFGV